MKRFTVPCDFNGVKHPFHVYVGEPSDDVHPLKYQSSWLKDVRGGTIPTEVMDSFGRLHAIAKENKVSFEDLCVYALGSAAAEEKNGTKPSSAEQKPSSEEQKP